MNTPSHFCFFSTDETFLYGQSPMLYTHLRPRTARCSSGPSVSYSFVFFRRCSVMVLSDSRSSCFLRVYPVRKPLASRRNARPRPNFTRNRVTAWDERRRVG